MKKNLLKLISAFSLLLLLFSCSSTPKENPEEAERKLKETVREIVKEEVDSAVKKAVAEALKEAEEEKVRKAKEAEEKLRKTFGISEPGLYAVLNTSQGNIRLQLYYKRVPETVANFVGLSEGTKKSNKKAGVPFYDGTVFHRVIDDFMIQGGDPTGTGRGGPGYRFKDEFHKDLKHDSPGILSMANAGPNTNGSQFFITHVPTDWLDNRHAVFGKVVDSSDQKVVNKIQKGDKIIKVKILRIGEDAKKFGK